MSRCLKAKDAADAEVAKEQKRLDACLLETQRAELETQLAAAVSKAEDAEVGRGQRGMGDRLS